MGEKGASLSPATHLERFHAVRGAMLAGIPMHKLSTVRGLLERAGESMTHSSHMASYIPKVEAGELSATVEDFCGQKPLTTAVLTSSPRASLVGTRTTAVRLVLGPRRL